MDDIYSWIVTGIELITGIAAAGGIVFTLSRKGRDRVIQPVMDEIAKIYSEITKSNTEIEKCRLSTLRLEILQNVHDTPEKVEVIEELFDEYKRCGGNGYVANVIAVWRVKYADRILEERIR